MLRKTFILIATLVSLFAMITATLSNVVAQNTHDVCPKEVSSEAYALKLRREYIRSSSTKEWQRHIQGVFENEQLEALAEEERIAKYKKMLTSDRRFKTSRGNLVRARDLPPYEFSDKNFDFDRLTRLEIIESDDDMRIAEVRNSSFYAADLRGTIFRNVHFMNCCFKEADLRNVYALQPEATYTGTYTGVVFNNCDFTGAEIGGAKFSSITRKQLLSTSNFRQYKGGEAWEYQDRKRVNLANCIFMGLNANTALQKEEFDLSGVDFNKFNNGNPTPAPLHAIGVKFGHFEMRNCNFQNANLRKSRFYKCNLEGSNFTKANLADANFGQCVLSKCSFEDAEIKNVRFIDYCRISSHDGFPVTSIDYFIQHPMDFIASDSLLYNMYFNPDSTFFTIDDCEEYKRVPLPAEKCIAANQLKSTASYKRKELLSVGFGFSDLSGVDFSRFNLTGCSFMGNLQNANFTDAVISGCSFGGCYAPNCDFNTLKTNLTIEQIKSTWNYKTGNMTGIKLPAEIQKQLDAEKQAVKN